MAGFERGGFGYDDDGLPYGPNEAYPAELEPITGDRGFDDEVEEATGLTPAELEQLLDDDQARRAATESLRVIEGN